MLRNLPDRRVNPPTQLLTIEFDWQSHRDALFLGEVLNYGVFLQAAMLSFLSICSLSLLGFLFLVVHALPSSSVFL